MIGAIMKNNNNENKEYSQEYFGEFGGSFIPKELGAILNTLKDKFEEAIKKESFQKELKYYLKNYVGRPSPLYLLHNMTKKLGGGKIYVKREDLNHMGAHKINNTVGQVLLAREMGLKKIIAETGAGQHGVATATAAATFGMSCIIYMGENDAKKQPLNVQRMKLLGAKVVLIKDGNSDLKAAVDAALNYLMEHYEDTFYVLGSAVGPYPYPSMVKYFQKIIGEEIETQCLEEENKLPDYVIAAVGGGSNAIGAFAPFIGNENVNLIGVEPAGIGNDTKYKASPLTAPNSKVMQLQGFNTYVLADEQGEIDISYSIASGLNYPGVGPEHAYLKDAKLATYVGITDNEALYAFKKLARIEGIIGAIESCHALAYAMKIAPTVSKDTVIVVNLSGRGDKDMDTILESEKVSIALEEEVSKGR